MNGQFPAQWLDQRGEYIVINGNCHSCGTYRCRGHSSGGPAPPHRLAGPGIRHPRSQTGVMGSERQQVSPLGCDQSGRLAETVTCRDLDPSQDRLITGLRMLQRGGEFVAVQGHHPIIMIGRKDQSCGIARTRADIVQRRVRQAWRNCSGSSGFP